MYNISLPRELMRELYELREKHGRGPIAKQVREAVKAYIVRGGCFLKGFSFL